MSLAQKILKGVLWTSLAKMSMQGVLFIVMTILARLLSKDDFGIVGMAAIITVAISLINDRGLGTAIVQRRELVETQLSSVFWGGIGFAVLLLMISFAVSFPLSSFFHRPLVQPVIAVFALDFVIGAFGIVQKSLLIREMNFKKLSVIETSSVLISGVISISIAFMHGGVWSLVAQTLVRDFVSVILVWVYCPWRAMRHFSWREFKELFGFSANVLGNDMAFYMMTNADVTIVGKILGSAALGSYSLALNMVKLPVTRLSGIVSRVTFPAFSALQDDLVTFKRGYGKSMSYIALITFPLLAFMGLYAQEFVNLFFGVKWADMVLPLIILTPMAMLKSVGTMRGSVLMARGKPQIELWWNCVYLIPLTGAVFFGTRWGLAGVASAFTILYLLTFPIIQTITNRQVNMTGSEFLKVLWPAFSACSVMFVAGWSLRFGLHRIGITNAFIVFISGLFFCTIVYILMVHFVHRHIIVEVFSWIKMARNSKQAASAAAMGEVHLS